MRAHRFRRDAALALTVWTSLGLLFGVQHHVTSQYAGQPFSWPQALGLGLGEWYFWGALFPWFRRSAHRFPIERGRRASGLAVLLSSVLVAALLRVLAESATLELTGLAPERDPSLLFHTSLLTSGLVVGAAHALGVYRLSQERSRRALEAEARLSEARLQLLKAQLQPHFLFNTLHSITTLMHRDVAAAETTLARLSDLLRIALERGEQQEVPLQNELEFTRRYLEIQRTRFGERLQVREAIDPTTLDALVPSMLVQPLVENAVQHGIAERRAGGMLQLDARRSGTLLELSVRDNGPGLKRGAENGGIGLRNTRERLERLYGPHQEFELLPGESGGLHVRVRLPFRSAAETS